MKLIKCDWRGRFFFYLIVLIFLFSGYPGAAQAQRVLKIGVPTDVTTLDVHMNTSTTLTQLFNIFSGLVQLNDNLQIIPGLAESWRMIDDKTWEFSIRKGARFHDATEVKASDVKFSYDRLIKEGAPSGPRKNIFTWFKSIDLVDEYKVQIKTHYPFPAALNFLSLAHVIIPEPYFKKVGAEGFARSPIGSGPFKMGEHSINESLKLESFDKYWGGKPQVDRVVFRVIPDESTRIAALLAKEVDLLINISMVRADELKKAGMNVKSCPSLVLAYMGMNTTTPPLNNVLVRRAIAHAIDIDAIIEKVLGGYATRSNSLVHRQSLGWYEGLKPYEYDLSKAKKLLQEAGFPKGIDVELDVSIGMYPMNKEIGEAIVGFLNDANIHVKLNVIEWGNYFEKFRGGKLKGLWLFGNVGASLDPHQHVHLNFASPKVKGRGIYFSSAATDDLIMHAANTVNKEKRAQLYKQLQIMLHEQCAAIPLFQYAEIAAMRPEIDWTPSGTNCILANTVRFFAGKK